MVNKKEKRTIDSLRILTALFSLVFAVFLWQGGLLSVHAQGTATVKVEGAVIRETANPSSTVMASVKLNDSLDVVAQTTGSDGYTWYKVYVDSNRQGYIRSDLVNAQGSIPAESASTGSSGGNTTTVGSGGNVSVSEGNDAAAASAAQDDASTGASAGQVAETLVETARVREQVNVRAGAGTNYDRVTSAPANTEVSVSGEATDGEGKRWYQISYVSADQTINGFIREDYLEVLAVGVEEPVVEEPVVEPEPVPEPVNQDYYLQYMDNGSGEMDWYLFDNIQGTSQSLTELLTAVAQVQENTQTENSQLSTMKIVIIVMGVALGICFLAITLLLFKLKDYSYEAYEEDEDEDEEEEEEEDDEDDEDEEEEEDIPVRALKNRFTRRSEASATGSVPRRTGPETIRRSTRSKESSPTSASGNKSWQSKDFLEADDDMEFEFLDL